MHVEFLNGLGVTFKYSGRLDEAEDSYRRALPLTESDDSTRATLFHNLGGLAHARGDYVTAEPLAARSVEESASPCSAPTIRPRPPTARPWRRSSMPWAATANEALLRDALTVFERTYGEAHADTAVSLNNLAAILQRRGQNDEAEQLYRRSLAGKETLLGVMHPELAATLNNLAVLARADGRYLEAERLYQRALSCMQGAVEPTHPNLASCRENYAALLDELGRRGEADALRFFFFFFKKKKIII